MKFLKAFCLILLLATSAQAQEKIESAFGMTIGAGYDPTNEPAAHMSDGEPIYQFYPTNAFRSFTRYYVLITPQTHKIYGVLGVGSIETTEKCKEEQALILEILSAKYGKPKPKGFAATLGDEEQIISGGRAISLKCSGFGQNTITILYASEALTQQATRERREIEKRKLDASGL